MSPALSQRTTNSVVLAHGSCEAGGGVAALPVGATGGMASHPGTRPGTVASELTLAVGRRSPGCPQSLAPCASSPDTSSSCQQ